MHGSADFFCPQTCLKARILDGMHGQYIPGFYGMHECPSLGDFDFFLKTVAGRLNLVKHSVNYFIVGPYCAQRKKENPGPAKNCERDHSYNFETVCVI